MKKYMRTSKKSFMRNDWDGCIDVIIHAVIIISVNAITITLLSLLGVLLWNYVVPVMFCLPEITFWKMVALIALIRLVFGVGVYNNINKNINGN